MHVWILFKNMETRGNEFRIYGIFMKKYEKINRAENTGKPPFRKSASWVPFSSLSLPVEANEIKCFEKGQIICN